MLSDTIEIIRGDSKYFTIEITDNEGNKKDILLSEKVEFSVKKNLRSDSYIIHKESSDIIDGRAIIHLTPSDTDVALSDDYYYDFQYTDSNMDVYTIARGTAQVVWEVTNNE